MDAGIRRRGREIALQVLYQVDAQGGHLTAEEALALYARHFGGPTADDSDPPTSEPMCDADLRTAREFAVQIVEGSIGERDEIDALITRASRNWRLDRMARVDRNILRLSAWELARATDVPARVAINEAIEIAKRFGTAESSAFINGILDRCLEDLGRKTPAVAAPGGKPRG